MPDALAVHGLSKRYGRTLALDNFSLTVPQGAVFGLLGPNGSGKSTLLKLIMGFLRADAGAIERRGLAPDRIGYLPERPFMPVRSPIEEYLSTLGRLAGLSASGLGPAVRDRLRQVGLEGVARHRINTCSRGMLQRLALAGSLLGDPPLLLWDEPLGGLDPAWQKSVRDLIASLAGQGKTILLSTHDLSDVEQTCSHVAILFRGRLVRCGPLAEVQALQPHVQIDVDRLPEGLEVRLSALGHGLTVAEHSISLRGEAAQRKAEVLRMLLEAGVDVRGLAQVRATLEQVYMEAIRS